MKIYRLLLRELIRDHDDIKLSKHANTIFQLINKSKLDYFNLQKEIEIFKTQLFLVKNIEYGNGCEASFYDWRKFILFDYFNRKRSQVMYERRCSFIQNELQDYSLSLANIEKNFEIFNGVAKHIFNKKNNQEIIFFIKDNYKKNVEIRKYFFNKNLNINNIESLERKYLNKIYKNICVIIGNNKEGHIYPAPISLEQKIDDKKRNLMTSKKNARRKFNYNFSNENKVSFLTLTLAHHNKNGTLSNDVKNINKTKDIFDEFIYELRYKYYKFLKNKKLKKKSIQKKMTEFKWGVASQIQEAGAWHFHVIFNIDLLKIFGHTNKMLVQNKELKNKKILKNQEFFETNEYYKINKQKYNIENGWSMIEDENLVIPNVFKLWADTVKKQLPNLKKLNPRSQNLQIFDRKPISNRKPISKNNIKTVKTEIKECEVIQVNIIKNLETIIADYVSKYNSGLTDDDIRKMIELKKNITGKNLFQFSRSCKKTPITKTLKLFPYDLQHSKYVLTTLYIQDITNFSNKHPFYKYLRNSILRANKKKAVFKNNSPGAFDFEKNKIKYKRKYIQKYGVLSCSYGKIFYEKTPYRDYKNMESYIKTQEFFIRFFNLLKLKTKIKFNSKIERNKYLLCFDNYINPQEQRLSNY